MKRAYSIIKILISPSAVLIVRCYIRCYCGTGNIYTYDHGKVVSIPIINYGIDTNHQFLKNNCDTCLLILLLLICYSVFQIMFLNIIDTCHSTYACVLVLSFIYMIFIPKYLFCLSKIV